MYSYIFHVAIKFLLLQACEKSYEEPRSSRGAANEGITNRGSWDWRVIWLREEKHQC